MATQNSNNLKVTNNADGYDVAGGTTARKLTVTGADITLTGSGSVVITFPSTTGTLAKLSDITGTNSGTNTGDEDTASITALGALMDSEVTNLAQVKAFDTTDYATALQGSLADS